MQLSKIRTSAIYGLWGFTEISWFMGIYTALMLPKILWIHFNSHKSFYFYTPLPSCKGMSWRFYGDVHHHRRPINLDKSLPGFIKKKQCCQCKFPINWTSPENGLWVWRIGLFNYIYRKPSNFPLVLTQLMYASKYKQLVHVKNVTGCTENQRMAYLCWKWSDLQCLRLQWPTLQINEMSKVYYNKCIL